MTTNLSVDVHIFTAGMGGAGKTTSLLNALSYFVSNQNENTSILVFDEGDNTDFSAHWVPTLSTSESKELSKKFKHDYSQLNYPGGSPIIAFEPLPLDSRGLKWNAFNKIIHAHFQTIKKKNHRIIALVDTGGAIGPVIRNAGNLGLLNPKYNWSFFPWILWTSNSLSNANYVETTKLGLQELEEGVESNGHEQYWKVYPLHVFNPIIQETLNVSTGFLNQLAELALPSRNPIIPIDTFFAYKRRSIGRMVKVSEFFELAEFAFTKAKVIDLAYSPLDVYKAIGKTLNTVFLDKECNERNEHCSFSNIFCIGIYDRKLATVKLSPGLIKKSLEDFNKEALSKGVAPVTMLSSFFGEVYNAFHFNLDAFYKSLGEKQSEKPQKKR